MLGAIQPRRLSANNFERRLGWIKSQEQTVARIDRRVLALIRLSRVTVVEPERTRMDEVKGTQSDQVLVQACPE